ncbi:MAG: 50S ribosomal protein L15 [Bacteroidetes bacterium QS_8_64_10]|nr:MAG: 50S ribosomal protein L15 [Bacteroidetes bacterium QS_8_64_10]
MDLSNLQPAEGATEERKRIGRGAGSGYGGHSSTRGTKGQKSRSGGKISVYFEGGQTPLVQRVPKFGFNSPFRTEYRPVNVKRLQRLADEDRLDRRQEPRAVKMVDVGCGSSQLPEQLDGERVSEDSRGRLAVYGLIVPRKRAVADATEIGSHRSDLVPAVPEGRVEPVNIVFDPTDRRAVEVRDLHHGEAPALSRGRLLGE